MKELSYSKLFTRLILYLLYTLSFLSILVLSNYHYDTNILDHLKDKLDKKLHLSPYFIQKSFNGNPSSKSQCSSRSPHNCIKFMKDQEDPTLNSSISSTFISENSRSLSQQNELFQKYSRRHLFDIFLIGNRLINNYNLTSEELRRITKINEVLDTALYPERYSRVYQLMINFDVEGMGGKYFHRMKKFLTGVMNREIFSSSSIPPESTRKVVFYIDNLFLSNVTHPTK